MEKAIALVIDDEPDICQLLEITLNRMKIQTIAVHTIEEAKVYLKTHKFNLCLTDMRLPDGDGLDLVAFLQNNHPTLPVAVITAHGNMETAIRALKLGAFDFISKPIDLHNLRDVVQEALKINATLPEMSSDFLIGESKVMEELRQNLAKVIRSQAPIYISGPSGSGKELVARIIHQSGSRREEPFIPVNCGAIPQELMESEFFGHLKGSFTGATFDKIGFFQAANKGTLFLDEVADLPLPMQVKLLRAIQEKAIRPIGSTKEIPVDIRVLSATHKDLQQLVQQNLFRQDLFYRIHVIELKVPSLKERSSDIPILTQYILKKISKFADRPVPTIDDNALAALNEYDFPGNVRELENILERAIILSDGKRIRLSDLQLPKHYLTDDEFEDELEEGEINDLPLDDYLLAKERQAIINALEKSNGNKTAAAKLLGISFRTLRYRLKKLGLENPYSK